MKYRKKPVDVEAVQLFTFPSNGLTEKDSIFKKTYEEIKDNKRFTSCPLCDAHAWEKRKKIDCHETPEGATFYFTSVYYHCMKCHEEFDLFCETDKNFLAAEEAYKESVK
jgi:hypothetical protein